MGMFHAAADPTACHTKPLQTAEILSRLRMCSYSSRNTETLSNWRDGWKSRTKAPNRKIRFKESTEDSELVCIGFRKSSDESVTDGRQQFGIYDR